MSGRRRSGLLIPLFSAPSSESWGIGESLYFTFVTGLTIGYGDLTPKHFIGRLLAIVIAFAGVVLIGLVAAVSVQALAEADHDRPE